MPAGPTELDTALTALEASEATLLQTKTDYLTIVTTLLSDVTAAFSRALAKIAAGSPDLQPEVDRVNALKTSIDAVTQNLLDSKTQVQSADAQATSEFN